MTNRIPLIVNAGAAQIQEIAASDTLQVPGNLTANVVQSDNYQYANGVPFVSSNYGNANVTAYLPTYTGNLVSLAGDVTTTANISGNYILGNGSQLTGLPAQYGNANVAAYLPTYTGNLTSVDYISANTIAANANVVATNILSATETVSGNLRAGNVSSVGNVVTAGIKTDNYMYANGTPVLFEDGYGNSNVQALLNSGAFTGDIIPNGNATQSLGSNTNQWLDLWVSNATIYLNSIPLGVSGNGVLQFDGNDIVTSGPNVVNTGNVETTGNVVGGNVVIATGGVLTFADGSTQTSAYGNAEVEAYLPSSNTIIAINSNVSNLTTALANTDSNVANLTTSLANTNSELSNVSNAVITLSQATTDAFGNTNSNVSNLATALSSTDSNVANLVTITTNTDSNVANLSTALANTNSDLSNVSNAVITLSQATTDAFANTNANVANVASDLSNTNSSLGNLTLTVDSQANAIANLQGSAYSNANVDSYLPVYTGNISGDIFTANILVGEGGNISNITGANVTGEVALANTVSNPNQPNITALGTIVSLNAGAITANTLQLAGNAQFDGNVYFAANVTIPGNIIQISGNSGNFYGDPATGFGALYAGIPAGFTPLINEVVQMAGNDNSYVQVTMRNLNAGSQATGDFVITADNGSDTTNHIDMGMASSSYNGLLANNSLGTSLYANDGYLYTRGNVTGGNLVLGSNQANGVVRIIAGSGSNLSDVVATFSTNGLSLTGDITVVGVASPAPVINGFSFRGPNVSAAGNVTGGNLLTAGFVSATGNATAGNFSTVGVITATGNITGGNLRAQGILNAIGNVRGGNILTPGFVTATGNVVGGNITTAGEVSATGNVTGNYLNGNGYYIPNVNAVQVINGTSNVTVPTTNGNVVITVGGTAQSTFDTAGNFRPAANVITSQGMLAEGNIYTESWLVANNQGVEAYQINVNQSVAWPDASAIYTDTNLVVQGNVGVGITSPGTTQISAGSFAWNFTNDGNISAPGNISAVGNITAGGFTTTGSNGNIEGVGNLVAQFLYGDGSNITGLPASYSDSNVSTYLASGNNTAGYSTTGNVTAAILQTSAGNSSNITGANYINANYFVGDGSLLTNLVVSTSYNDSNVVTLLASFGSNVISTTGNVTASYVVGDGSLLTNIPTPAPVIGTVTSGSTITPTGSSTQYNVTALATSATIAAPSGVPLDGQKLTIRILDNGTPQTLSWNAIYQVIGTTLPTTTTANKYIYVGCIYNAQDTTWDVVSVAQQA